MNERRGCGNSARPEGGLSAQGTGCAGAKPTTTRSVRRGAVVLIRHGDPEISGGIVEALLGATEGRESDLIRQRSALPPTTGLPGPVSLETAHCAVSRALDAPKGEGSGEPDEPKALPNEQVEVVEAEIDRQRIQRALLRVAVGNTKTDADYEIMRTKARGDYAVRPLRGIAGALLKAYAIVVLALSAAFRALDIVLGRR